MNALLSPGPAQPRAAAAADHPLLRGALAHYEAHAEAATRLLPDKARLLRHFDVGGMQRAVNICYFGRSGSFLLASYLDAHEDVVMLPQERGAGIYLFWEKHPGFSVWEKLIAYPAYMQERYGEDAAFFGGDFPLAAPEYYAAVLALAHAFGDQPDRLASRQRFFQLLHVAYALALGRAPASATPLMVYAQHACDDTLAAQFIADFPQGLFLHTVRDPISAVDSWFDRQLEMQSAARGHQLALSLRYVHPATETLRTLLICDGAHRGMAARTRAVRFEDLHRAPQATMSAVAAWLGLTWSASLTQSTFNGAPFVWKAAGRSWVGPNPDNARRRFRHLDPCDRLLLFALLQRNFLAWDYPLPRALRSRALCALTLALLWLKPLKMEWLTARLVLKEQAWPALRAGHGGFALRAPYFLAFLRARMLRLLARESWARLRGRRVPLVRL